MDIKQLKFLVALDETRHFGQAAARCHVTQPTLSMRLRGLEDELGLQLVTRSQRFEGFRSEEHTSELQSLMRISSAVFCLITIHSIMYYVPHRYFSHQSTTTNAHHSLHQYR